jgi:hypothetical protein
MMRHVAKGCLAGIVVAFLCSTPAVRAADQGDQGASIHGTISASVSFFGVSGDKNKFQAVHDRPEGLQLGIDNFTIHAPQKGWSLDASGSLLQPGYYKLDLALKKPDLGFVKFDYYRFDTWDDGSNLFYPVSPFVYQRGGDNLTETRSNMGVTFGWTPPDGPKVTLRLERWRLDGDRVLARGGEVRDNPSGFRQNVFPLIEDLDQTRDRATLGVEQDVGNFHYRFSQMYENYEGRNQTTASNYLNGALAQTRLQTYTPDFSDWTTNLEIYGDLIKDILRLDFTGEFVTLKTNSGYDENAFDPSGAPSSASFADNYVDNSHNGDLQRLLADLRLTYTPNEIWTAWAGIGYKKERDDNQATLNDEDLTTGGIADTSLFFSDRDRHVMMYNLGLRARPADWIIAEAEGHWERGDVNYHWTGIDPTAPTPPAFQWMANEGTNCNEYTASVTMRPVGNVKLIGRAKHTMVDGDYLNLLDDEGGVSLFMPGTTQPTAYPGFVGSYDRIMDELSAIVQYRALSNLYLAYKFIRRTEEFRVLKLANPDTADQHSIINSLSVTYTPCEKLSLSGYGSLSNYEVHTLAQHNATPVSPFNGDSNTLGLDASYALSGSTALSGGLLYTRAESIADQHYSDLYLGLSHQISKVWTLNCRYMHSTFGESGNGGINDYRANGVTVGLSGRF